MGVISQMYKDGLAAGAARCASCTKKLAFIGAVVFARVHTLEPKQSLTAAAQRQRSRGQDWTYAILAAWKTGTIVRTACSPTIGLVWA